MKKMNKSPFAAAMGAAIITTATATAHAEANPFGMTELNSGYMQLAAGEMACGANMGGMDKSNMNPPQNKTAEGACAGQKPAAAPAPAQKATEGKCGEGKCASMMNDGQMKKGMENVCGAMMKGKEGSCGATKKDK